jgi:hypothetical protein
MRVKSHVLHHLGAINFPIHSTTVFYKSFFLNARNTLFPQLELLALESTTCQITAAPVSALLFVSWHTTPHGTVCKVLLFFFLDELSHALPNPWSLLFKIHTFLARCLNFVSCICEQLRCWSWACDVYCVLWLQLSSIIAPLLLHFRQYKCVECWVK